MTGGGSKSGSPNPLLQIDPNTGLHPLPFYGYCMMGGFAACGFTHAGVVTLDVAKVRTQAYGKAGKWPNGLLPSIHKTWANEGLRGITMGWAPTFWGYGAQGLFKFGFNELFKDLYSQMLGGHEVVEQSSTLLKMSLWAAASGSAEVFADVALCPFEMTKVRMQVTLPGQDTFPYRMMPALQAMSAQAAETKFPFGSLYPLWGRQVPYTMIKFVGFYQTQEFVYHTLEQQYGKVKSDFSKAQQLGITFACGYWAGIFCAVATQPMDNLVSMKGTAENKSKTWGQMAADMGIRDLFLKGLSTRIIMIGTLTGMQWYIYGAFKSMVGLGTS